ncbi:MAG: hypothetical protein MJZ30_14085 [Paludibacteraceae bacterium]|nr:hypothetical protein [Paludibacteraceae bacterium]
MEIVSSTNPPDGDGKYILGTVVEFRPNYTYTVFDVSDGTNALVASNGVYSVTVGTSDINITATINHEYNVNLAEAPYDFTALNNDVLSGTTERTVTIANGANITLSNATINGGIVCEGSATIILEGSNNVKGYSSISKNVFKAGIQVGGEGTVLTIKGNGSLTAIGSDGAAGIGLDCVRYVDAYGGDIVIEGGTINAIGSGSGAGIGTGFAYGGANIVRLGNITIKGGSVKATSGGSAEGIGSGLVNPGSTNEFGTVTIYDSVVLVDASSIGKDITYMHGESNVTANKTDYFNISEDGNRRVIAPKDDADYSISIANDIEHGTLTGAGAAKYTEKVTITVTPDFGYRISRLIVKDANNNDVVIDGNSFVMPKGNVTVSAIFEQGPHGTTEFVWQNVSGSIVKENIIYDGVTTLNLEANSNYKIVSKDQTYLRLDKSTVDIPYSDGVGEFIDDDKSTIFYFRNIPSGFYDIILTDLGDDRWSVSILKTVAALDNVPDQTYTGSEIKPEPLVLAGSLSLTEGTDYEYSYSNNINVGTATVTVTFLGEYDWVNPVSKSFNITKATPTVEPPTSANPKFAGTCVALVTAGSTNFGTMLYSLDDDYSENIPCADKGGDYTVYYEVEESGNWSGAAGSVEIQVPVRVDVTVVGDGSVSGYDPDEFYPVGTVLTLTAEPDEDYRFTGWDDDFDAPAERVWTVLADAKDNELTVNFQQKTVCYGAVCVYNDGINEVEATIDGDSNIPWSIPEEIRVQRVNLNRNFARQGYSTIVLPFDFEEIEVDEAEFYELDGVSFANDKWNVSVTPVSEIRPNTPYLIHVMKNNVSFSGDIALRPIDYDVDCSVTKNGWELCGTYEYKVWKDGNPELGRVYGFAAEERDGARIGQFVRLAYNASAKPLRAYLRYVGSPRPAPALFKAAPAVASIDELPESMDVVIRGEEGTTVIGTINTRTGEFRSADNRWFDLNGRYLGNKKPSVKGTYYNNGKKVIVK